MASEMPTVIRTRVHRWLGNRNIRIGRWTIQTQRHQRISTPRYIHIQPEDEFQQLIPEADHQGWSAVHRPAAAGHHAATHRPSEQERHHSRRHILRPSDDLKWQTSEAEHCDYPEPIFRWCVHRCGENEHQKDCREKLDCDGRDELIVVCWVQPQMGTQVGKRSCCEE